MTQAVDKTNKQVAFIGLGVMGFPMAGHLAAAGHQVTVFNRTHKKAQKWLETYGGVGSAHRVAETPAQAAEGADFVFACVGADSDLLEVTLGPRGIFEAMAQDAVFIDHTTASASAARHLAGEAHQRGFGMLDAPVSGGEAGAVGGTLTVMCGGDEEVYLAAAPIMEAYAKSMRLLGAAGSGQLAKMVNQICIAGIVQGLAEALHLSESAGLDTKAVLDVISKGAAQSWQMENRGATMVDGEFDFGFAVDWMRKDLSIVLEEARRLGISLPVTALVDQFYGDVQKMGGSRQDTSSLIRRFRG